jgi:ribulose-5-phosphate 4-epimerase/fuculose-1-phosphate aldolase
VAIDEGYIKYVSRWTEGPAPAAALTAELERWRKPLFDAGLVGHYADLGVGYGNLSIRAGEPGQFIITGTQTGHLERTAPGHYALVTKTDIVHNTVWSTGPVRASSEAMTHAAIYALSTAINAVVHVHSAALWQRWRDVLPTTGADVPYGTPAMAAEFTRLWTSGHFRESGLAVMAGHEEGIVSIGQDLAEAAERVLALAASD